MDNHDRHICSLLQADAKQSTATLADAVGLPPSTVADRVRRLHTTGVIRGAHASLAPDAVGADLCAFVLVDIAYDGEAAATTALCACPEVLELHHISGPHSYLLKVRVASMAALQTFLDSTLKPLGAVARTETILALDTLKETAALPIAPADPR